MPEHIVAFATATVGFAFTVKLTVFVLLQPEVVPVTVYVPAVDEEIVDVVAPVFQL